MPNPYFHDETDHRAMFPMSGSDFQVASSPLGRCQSNSMMQNWIRTIWLCHWVGLKGGVSHALLKLRHSSHPLVVVIRVLIPPAVVIFYLLCGSMEKKQRRH